MSLLAAALYLASVGATPKPPLMLQCTGYVPNLQQKLEIYVEIDGDKANALKADFSVTASDTDFGLRQKPGRQFLGLDGVFLSIDRIGGTFSALIPGSDKALIFSRDPEDVCLPVKARF